MNTTKTFSIVSLILGIISFISATVLTIEKLAVLKDPSHVLSCNLSPFVSCGPVMNSAQAAAFGIPNSIVGMVGFGLVILISFTSLFVKFPLWYWVAYAIGVTLAFGFIIWLMTQALVVISALCIYCLVVWICIIPLFWFAVANLLQRTRFRFIQEYKFLIIGVTYIILALCIFFAFKDYWLSLL